MLFTLCVPLPASAPCTHRRLSVGAEPRCRKLASNHQCCGAAPRVSLQFKTAEGPVNIECDSGDILRDVMLEQKVDLYTTWGKVWQCGGNGQCGTCVVKASGVLQYSLMEA